MSIVISNAPISSDIPKLIPGLQIWLDANDSNTMSFSASNAVSQWRDKSSNGFIFNTITGTPLLQSDSYKQGIFFNSAQSNLMRTTTAVTWQESNTTIFAVGSQTSSIVCSMMISFGSSNDTSLRFGNNGTNINDIFYNQTINYNGATPSFLPTGPTNYFVTNGVLGYTVLNSNGVIGGAIATSNIQLSTDFSINGNRNYHGYMNEIIIYTNPLTSDQRLQVEGYLAWKWGVLNRFPKNYTYANSNPSLPINLSYPYSGKATNDNLGNPFSSRITSYNWSPNNISGLLVWYDSADGSTLANSGQTSFTWASKGSFTPLAMTVPSGCNGPSVTTYNGFPGIYFNGTNTKLSVSGLTTLGASATTWITCATNLTPITGTTPVDASLVIASITPEKAIRFDCNVNATIYTFNNGSFRADVNNNSNGVRGFIDQANYFRAYQNGVNVYSTNNSVTYQSGSPSVTLQMGQWSGGTLLGYIHEVMIFNRELTIDEYQKTEAYLAWKYGYQKQLPSSYPYYWFPPN